MAWAPYVPPRQKPASRRGPPKGAGSPVSFEGDRVRFCLAEHANPCLWTRDGARRPGSSRALLGTERSRVRPRRVRAELLDTDEPVEGSCYNLPRELGLVGANPAYATELSQLVEALQLDSAYVEDVAAFVEVSDPRVGR